MILQAQQAAVGGIDVGVHQDGPAILKDLVVRADADAVEDKGSYFTRGRGRLEEDEEGGRQSSDTRFRFFTTQRGRADVVAPVGTATRPRN